MYHGSCNKIKKIGVNLVLPWGVAGTGGPVFVPLQQVAPQVQVPGSHPDHRHGRQMTRQEAAPEPTAGPNLPSFLQRATKLRTKHAQPQKLSQ